MPDCYLYDDVPVLRNKLGIRDDKTLDQIEAEQSRANMMLLYDESSLESEVSGQRKETYRKYQKEKYEPQPHYKRED